jgi:hypothetical protein
MEIRDALCVKLLAILIGTHIYKATLMRHLNEQDPVKKKMYQGRTRQHALENLIPTRKNLRDLRENLLNG